MARTGEATEQTRPLPIERREYDFSRYLPYHLTFPVGTISRVLAAAMQTRFSLKSAHWRIVSLLGSLGAVSTRDLANYLSTEKSAISRATTELIARGYVVRIIHPVDRRLLMLHFSARGKRLFEQMSAVALEFEDTLLQQVSPEEVAQLDKILGKLSDAAVKYEADMKGAARPRRRAAATAAADADSPPAERTRRAKARES